MAATASIIIEVDQTGAAQAFQQINAQTATLTQNLRTVPPASDQAFNSITSGAQKARQSAALVSQELGVNIPRAMRNVIAGMPGIASAISSAFNVLAIVGFIEIAKSAGEAVTGLVEYFTHWAETAKKTMDAQVALNQVFIQGQAKIDDLNKAYQLIGLQGVDLYAAKQKMANQDLSDAQDKVTKLTAALATLQKQAQETGAVTKLAPAGAAGAVAYTETDPTDAALAAQAKIPGALNDLAAAQKELDVLGAAARNAGGELGNAFSTEKAEGVRELNTAIQQSIEKLRSMATTAQQAGATPEQQVDNAVRAELEGIAQFQTLYGQDENLQRQSQATSVAIEKSASDQKVKIAQDEADKKLKIMDQNDDEQFRIEQEQAIKLRRMETQTETDERNAAIAMASPWERANATIVADYEERMQRIQEMLSTGELNEEQAARQSAAAYEVAWAQSRDQMANDMEQLFDNLTSGNIGKAFLSMFKQMVFQMVATWMMGMRGMQAASQQSFGGGGGMLGAILPSIFGGGGMSGGSSGTVFSGMNGGGIFSMANGGVGAAMGGSDSGWSSSSADMGVTGLGFSAGGGYGSYGQTMPYGASRVGGYSGIAGLLSRGGGLLSGVLGLAGMAGGAMLGSSNLAMKSIGGLLMGGSIGAALAGSSIGMSLGMFGAMLGPIGAVAGLLIGLFSGLFGSSTKKARLAIEANMKQQAQKIEDAYNLYQEDWTTATSDLEDLRNQGVQALQQAGVKDIDRARKGHVDQWIDKAENDIDATQAERNQRAQIAFGPAQFALGGYVHPSLAGGVLGSIPAGTLQFATGGAVPAIVHAGEYVLNATATSRIGVPALNAMNSGFGGGDTHIYISAIDAPSFRKWLDGSGGREIKNWISYEVYRGGW